MLFGRPNPPSSSLSCLVERPLLDQALCNNNGQKTMQIIDDIIVYGDPVDPGALTQIKVARQTASHAFLMADHHKGYSIPIGGVVAYENAVSPSGVGYDIGCGNKAIRLSVRADEIDITTILDAAEKVLQFGIGKTNPEILLDETPLNNDCFDDPLWLTSELLRKDSYTLQVLAVRQFGTIGSGNHYVDIFSDEKGFVWVGVHFGSRGLGHKIATHFLKAAGAKDRMDEPPCVLSLDSDLGQQYWEHMELAGKYAYAGRDWVCARMHQIIGGEITDTVHNHHNFAWKERHFGSKYVVVRKGATPAFPHQRGFVGGTMGECSVILEGVYSDENKNIMDSTVHGAGRVMSRTAAAGKFDYKTRKRRPGGQITQNMMDEWLHREGVQLRGGDRDEAPHAYKRLDEVLNHHSGTINILYTLKPLGVMMA